MKTYDGAVTTIGIGSIGIFVAYIMWYLNENEIWVDQVISASTSIQDVMAIIIMIFLLVGVLISAMRN